MNALAYAYSLPLASIALSEGWKPWKTSSKHDNDPLLNQLNGPIIEAIYAEGQARLSQFLKGVDAYITHPYYPHSDSPHADSPNADSLNADHGLICLARQDGIRVLALSPLDGVNAKTPISIIVPSLINRYHILDLDQSLSFMRALAKTGIYPLILDWGECGGRARHFSIGDYVARANMMLSNILPIQMQNLNMIGYCMGGLLGLAMAAHFPLDMKKKLRHFIAIATPYDFHASLAPNQINLWQQLPLLLGAMLQAGKVLPVDMLQSWFLSLDPLVGFKKYQAFAAWQDDPKQEKIIQQFIAREDWLNNGVPLAGLVAKDIIENWYGKNQILSREWTVLGKVIAADCLDIPALAVTASHDRLVPLASANAFVSHAPKGIAYQMNCGHVGMMSNPDSLNMLVAKIADFLQSE
ncbi:MAG: alpha/beta fold hydrolase [Alphaproteobacteria bacterium]